MEKVEKDYEELLKLFNKYGVEYCIVGAFAVAFYAVPRYTKDLDVLVKPEIENATRIMRALEEFGFGKAGLEVGDFSHRGSIVQLGYEPVRIDIITSVDGCERSSLWNNRKKGTLGGEEVFFIGLNELIKNKQAAHRKQDLADLELLVVSKRRTKKRK